MPSGRPARPQGGPPWWLIVVAAVAIVGGLFLWQRARTPVPTPPPAASAPAEEGSGAGQPPAPAPGTGADIGAAAESAKPKYPLPGGEQAAAALPAPEHSDAPILEALLGLASRSTLARFLNMQDFARRFVVTVDHLPRELIPTQLNAARPMPGKLVVAEEGDAVTLQPANFARYDAFVHFAESLDARKTVAVYLRFYPLLQSEYQAMGFPHGHFNDRVVEAIDDMLAAPEVTGPIRLVQPKVHYRYADPLLEKLSAGRKIMIRVGPANAARLKKVLRAIRAELVR